MEVAIGSNSNNVAPFQREVREWQRVDPNTGAYLSGRLEADRWINGSLNAYGKVVNSQNISNQNGSIKQSQRNQLEVLQARTSSGSLQVVRAQTVQTMTSTSSSHCWPSSSSSLPSSTSSPTKTKALALTGATSTYHVNQKNNTFDNQRFATNSGGYQLQQKLKQQQQKEHHHQHHRQQQQQQKSRHLTNGNILTDSHDDDHLTTTPLNSSHHNNRHTFVTAPSVKLSTLMKSNAAAAAAVTSNTTTIATIKNDEGRNSPHFLSNSMSLLQQRQQHQNDHHYYTEHEQQQQQQQQQNQHESESQSSSFTTDSRYHLLPTMRAGEVRVGVEIINTNQMEPLRNERETTTLGHSHINYHEQEEEEEGDENENEEYEEESLSQHHRGRSVSTDDLATEWNQNDNDDESSEWRRVSKIRRSFQFPKSTSPKINISRPSDLPENSGSVSRIRNELENGRRLNTAMRNNNVDLVALNNILNGTRENDNKITKKATFLTAESLKEIRGKLKKLSDETLYKDDFITQTNIDDEENINVTNTRLDNGTNVYSIQQPIVLQDAQVVQQSQQSSFQYQPKFEGNYTTNSLESRTKYRDTNSSEWHLRRKSYGFEKMTSSENPMFRMETSTDSGIGRSGDLANWSPTENTAAAGAAAITTATSKNLSSSNPVTIVEDRSNNTQKTTVKLTNDDNSRIFERPVIVQRRLHPRKTDEPEIIKRHSIAVDEAKYVGGENMRKTFETKLSSIHVNGFTSTKDTNILQINTPGSATTADETGRRQKRVEFCKTEVHFAAESGRVNIVETDGKPPPTNNFRRRRRSQSSSSSSSSTTLLSTLPGNNNLNNSYLDTINSGMPLIHFGDEKKAIFDQQENDLGEIKDHKNNITISIPIKSVNDNNNSNSNSNSDRIIIPKTTSIIEIEDESSNSEEVSLRSILKNKPIKPKPYHLGESIDPAGESLWGVRLRPVVTTTKIDQQDVKDRTTCIRMISPPQELDHKESFEPIKSVAERIKIVEERKDGSGYSTKINLNISDSPYSWNVPDTEIYIEEKPTTILRLEESSSISSSLSSSTCNSYSTALLLSTSTSSSSSSSISSTSSVTATAAEAAAITGVTTATATTMTTTTQTGVTTPQKLSTQLKISHDNLKSTSLIMKTMRLTNHNNNNAEYEIEKSNQHHNNHENNNHRNHYYSGNDDKKGIMNSSLSTKMILKNDLVKSGSDNSIYHHYHDHHENYNNSRVIRPKYSLDGNIMLNDILNSYHGTENDHQQVALPAPSLLQTKEKSTSPICIDGYDDGSEFHNRINNSQIHHRLHHHNHHNQYTSNTRKMEILQEEMCSSSSSLSSLLDIKRPILIPKIQILGASNTISHQLSQLRQICDSSGHESDDSAKADEEVNHIFGGGNRDSDDHGRDEVDENCMNGSRNDRIIHYNTNLDKNTSEISNSWNRGVKTKYTNYDTKEDKNIIENDGIQEFSKMNIMSIELHSPSSSITRIVPTDDIPKKIEIPVPKPRTVSPVKFARNILDNEHKSISNIQHNDTEYRQIKKSIETNSDKKEPLKVVTGGARKLREHELSYFGIKKDDSQNQKTKSSQRISNHAITSSVSNNHNNNNHSINNKKVLNILDDDQIQKWKLSSDKPDLLRHSPVASKRNKLPQETELDKQKINDDGPIYENLKKPSTYSRKKDLKRDEMILNEMTKTADLTMKTVTNCSKQTTDQDHSQHHRSTKPLDTIDEKAAVSRPSSNNSLKKIKSKAMQASRYPTTSDHFQRACCSNRPSSASSIESLNRYPKSSKSRSQSKESNLGKIEYANIRSTKKLTTTSARNENNKSRHRSQSRERHHHHHQQRTRSQSHHSSSDDFENSPKVELIPRIRKPTKSRGGGGVAVEKNTPTTSNSGTKENEHKRTAMMAKRTTTKSIAENVDHRYKNQTHQNSRSVSDDRNVKPTRRTTTTANIEKTDKISSSKRSSPASTNDHHNHNHTISSDSSTINNHYSKIRTRSTSSGIVSSTSSPSKHRTIKEHTRK